MEFDLDALIGRINADRSKSSNPKDRLNRVTMNGKDKQGLLTYLPIISKLNGNFYMKFERVYEFYGDTSLIQSGEAWYKILPIECYPDLSSEEMELYNEVKGYLDTLNNNEEVDYDEFRVRNYVVLFGICLSLKNTEGKKLDDYKDAPCLFVYPSNSVVDALGTAINNKIDAMQGRREWIPMVISPNNTGRKGVVQVSFVKSAGVGYDCQVSFEFNSELNVVVDPNYTIEDKIMEMFDNPIPTFMGWIYNSAEKRLFNPIAFKELRDQLKLRIKMMNEQGTSNPQPADSAVQYENKNNLTPQPQPEAQPNVIKKTPF